MPSVKLTQREIRYDGTDARPRLPISSSKYESAQDLREYQYV